MVHQIVPFKQAMRCWLLVLLVGLHRVTDFLPNAQTKKNRSGCETDYHYEIYHPMHRLSPVPWHERPLSGLFHSQPRTTGDCKRPSARVNLGGNMDAVPHRGPLEVTFHDNPEKDDAPNEANAGSGRSGPAKLDSFEKWKHSQLCRYLKEQRKQSTCAQTLTRINQETETPAKDDHYPVGNTEQLPEEPGRDCLNQGTSNGNKFNHVNVAHTQAEASFSNHLELKLLKAFRQRKNFANANCGAKVVAANSQAQNAKEILSENRDGYMLNPCKAKIWFIVELCERIQIESVEIASFELFARVPKRFRVSATEEFDPALMNGDPELDSSEQQSAQKVPVRWYDLGAFSLQSPTREIHKFNVSSAARQLDEELAASNRANTRQDAPINVEVGTENDDEKESRVTNSHGYIYALIRKLREEPYVKYVRFEMLEYEGTEHYCPLSLVRIYGSTLEEVINMHEQADDSLIDAIVSMPGNRPTSERVATATTHQSDRNETRQPSISHYMFTLVQSHKEKYVSPKRCNNVVERVGTPLGNYCINPMNDVRSFQLMCSSIQRPGEERSSDAKLSDSLQPLTNISRPTVAMPSEKSTGPEMKNSTDNGVTGETDVTSEQTDKGVPQLENNVTLKEANLSDLGQTGDPIKQHNGSGLRPGGKTGNSVSGGVSSQPVLVRYGNRLNLLELNTTLYAIYLDQLSEHYNAHMQDLSAKLQQISRELRAQVRHNEQIVKFAERQSIRMTILEDRLRQMESKLDRYSYGGHLLPITICCTFFACLLTFLLSAAVNSHSLFQSGTSWSTDQTPEIDEMSAPSAEACDDLDNEQCTKPSVRLHAATDELIVSTDDNVRNSGGPLVSRRTDAECAMSIERVHRENLDDRREYSPPPLKIFPSDFLKIAAMAR